VTKSLTALEANILDANDEFKSLTPQQIATLAARIEQVLVEEGIAVPDVLTRIIQAIPLILALFGGFTAPAHSRKAVGARRRLKGELT
jgi:hypothetical protein